MDLLRIWAESFLLLWAPGHLIARVWRSTPRYDPLVDLAIRLGLGIAFWPVLFACIWAAGVRLDSNAGQAISLLVIAAASVDWLRQRLRHGQKAPLRPFRVALVLTAAVIAITALTRIAHVRDMAAPAWVDSVHHVMIVRLLMDHGTVPASFAPYIEQGSFYYHWGFHALAAFLAWLHGAGPMELPRLVLSFGQFLGALVPLAVYAAARVIMASSRAASFAAILAGVVSFFPAYYVFWGRYTHLAAAVLLPCFIAAAWRLAARASRGGFVHLAILAAGLALIHVRVAFFAATWIAVFVTFLAFTERRRSVFRLILACILGLAVTAPWLARLATDPYVRKLAAPPQAEARWESVSAVAGSQLLIRRNPELIALATGGLAALTPFPLRPSLRIAAFALWIAIAVLLERSRRKRRPSRIGGRIALVAAWVAMTAVAMNAHRFGLPRLNAVPNHAAIITLFLPLALCGGAVLHWLVSASAPPNRRTRVGVAIAVLAVALGAPGMFSLRNRETQFVEGADLEALAWIRRHVQPNALFASGARSWIGGSFVGVDGGYWISVLTDRRSILPPVLYEWSAPAESVARTDRLLALAATSTPGAMIDAFRDAGVTHLYIGPANVSRAWRRLVNDPRVCVLEANGGAFVLSIDPCP